MRICILLPGSAEIAEGKSGGRFEQKSLPSSSYSPIIDRLYRIICLWSRQRALAAIGAFPSECPLSWLGACYSYELGLEFRRGTDVFANDGMDLARLDLHRLCGSMRGWLDRCMGDLP